MDNMPELRGSVTGDYDGRYRLYTVAEVPFGTFPEYPSGPGRVVIDGWHMSTSSLSRAFSSPSVVTADDGMHTLSLSRHDETGERMRHELDGTKYPTSEGASRAAYEAGCLAYMVYERDAHR